MESRRSPRILITGFSSFPGVPENPTEALIGALRDGSGALRPLGDVHLATLAVDYRSLPARLAELGRNVQPDIALHFGVSRSVDAFALETVARNTVCTLKPDNSGYIPTEAVVRAGGESIAASLPVERIAAALSRHGLPAVFSDHAGDYLCNTLFYLSCGKHCPPFAPVQAGFIHVPPFGTPLAGSAREFDLATLVEGAAVICAACAEAWTADKKKAAPMSRAAF